MDVRGAFLEAAAKLFPGFAQLASFRLVGNSAQLAVLDVHVRNPDAYANVRTPAIRELRLISPEQFASFTLIHNESSMVLSFSWLESFLGEAEEALYLTSPASLGEQVQVKLGKILDVSSVEELIHDIAKRRVRERSQWSLTNRLRDLQEHHRFSLTSTFEDIDWLSDTRNRIIHDRRIGEFRVNKKRVSYQTVERADTADDDAVRFLHVAINTVADVYEGACRALKVSAKMPTHKANLQIIGTWRKLWTQENMEAAWQKERLLTTRSSGP